MKALEDIIRYKKIQVKEMKARIPVKELEQSQYFVQPCVSLANAIQNKAKHGIIAEFKRRSPSRGDIHANARPAEICTGYMQAGASALSILTDTPSFGGSNVDVVEARGRNTGPILRKEFIIDEYQITEAKSIGADAVLLIAAILTKKEIGTFTEIAQSLGLEVLLEIHEENELDKITEKADLIGVNSRCLKTMTTLRDRHVQLVDQLPKESVKIAESGISTALDAFQRQQMGYDGFLIGTEFMSNNDPAKACAQFINELQTMKVRALKKI